MRYLSACVTAETAAAKSLIRLSGPLVDDRSRVAKDTADVFLAPFTGTTPSLHVQNIANTHPSCIRPSRKRAERLQPAGTNQ